LRIGGRAIHSKEAAMTKEWYKSKTFWFNVLALIVAVATAFGYGEMEPEPWVGAAATVIVTVINLVLRLAFTKTELTR
jgi:hypothetical protein